MGDPTEHYHRLKTWPPHFQEIIDGQKTFEIRRNDRGFKENDYLILEEYVPDNGLTGRVVTRKIGKIIEGQFGLKEGFCALSLLSM